MLALSSAIVVTGYQSNLYDSRFNISHPMSMEGSYQFAHVWIPWEVEPSYGPVELV